MHLSIYLSIHLNIIYVSIHTVIYVSIHHISVSIHPSIHLYIHLCIYPLIYPSIRLCTVIYHLSIVLIPSPYIQFRTLFPSSIQIKKLNWNLKAIPTLIVNGSHNPFINYNSSHSSPDVTTWLWGFALIQTQASVRSGPDIG